MLKRWLTPLGRALARYLSQPLPHYTPAATSSPAALLATLRPADVLLVEGNTRVSTAIKYLTQSTWSHAALYVGDALLDHDNWEDPPVLVEVDMVHGCQAVPLSKYAAFHTRICRPVGLSEEDRRRVVEYVIARLGQAYDLKNLIDLARYLLPVPPVPSRFRRRMLALGSGEPTKAICSTLIAQAFQSVRYPILPLVSRRRNGSGQAEQEILSARHYSLFTPRDFDISPYFQVVKPTIEQGFDYRRLNWDTAEDAPQDAVQSSAPG
ncbi:YiiX/YebB-like N1pC/P60 family cysteine hydrolase [Pelomicrobium methylotrophicum]|uniref:Lipo-like protein n=1 Tax=Pelomicrobium methylotrophicum TaxID=2602750 RepID=A0A5C7ESS3_9PROT|nr:YiiX/YebB-like N1pC/P60 family cysteine hydrolase [Pelomicrobium methylotrophicum]TXF10317.1 lipo-like protein [Pelomicrobium methylotrophicum]